jgi:hypothetical protein
MANPYSLKDESGRIWSRCHAAAHDLSSASEAEDIAARYRKAPRWADYDIAVRLAAPNRYFIAASKRT